VKDGQGVVKKCTPMKTCNLRNYLEFFTKFSVFIHKVCLHLPYKYYETRPMLIHTETARTEIKNCNAMHKLHHVFCKFTEK